LLRKKNYFLDIEIPGLLENPNVFQVIGIDIKKLRDFCMRNGTSKDEACKEVSKAICEKSLEIFKNIKVIKDSTGVPIEVDLSEVEVWKDEI